MRPALAETYPADRVFVPREGLERVPIYHARGEYRQLADRDELRTYCGVVVYAYLHGGRELVDRTSVRFDHARKFGTPCRRCWRDA